MSGNSTYPEDEAAFSEEQIKYKLSECNAFEESKTKLYKEINKINDGHLVCVHQFFRSRAKYYMVTEAIQDTCLSIEDIAALPYESRLLVCCMVAHAVFVMHRAGIVHADIKPDNILVTNGKSLQAHIIDFDCSFFEDAGIEPDEELNGDLVYLSPEAFLFMAEVESKLSRQMDVFSLGLVFHQYLTGEMPDFDANEYAYAYEAVLDDKEVVISEWIEDEKIRNVLANMLNKNPEDRFSISTVFLAFKDALAMETVKEDIVTDIHLTDIGVKHMANREEPEEKEELEKAESFFATAGDL